MAGQLNEATVLTFVEFADKIVDHTKRVNESPWEQQQPQKHNQ
jgi:hypothetical protein